MFNVYDNFLEKNEFKKIKEEILSPFFPWYKNDFIAYENKEHPENEIYNMQFTHTFYKNYSPQSNLTHILDPIIKKINPLSIIRIKANLGIAREKIFLSGYHTDVNNDKITTAVFYINSNNGKTIFENGQEVESIENRFISFNSSVKHSGTSCTDSKYRCVINFNYIEE